MNHQEICLKSPRSFVDVRSPRLYPAWPYFILVVAALLTGTARLSIYRQQNLPHAQTPPTAFVAQQK